MSENSMDGAIPETQYFNDMLLAPERSALGPSMRSEWRISVMKQAMRVMRKLYKTLEQRKDEYNLLKKQSLAQLHLERYLQAKLEGWFI